MLLLRWRYAALLPRDARPCTERVRAQSARVCCMEVRARVVRGA